MSEQRRYDEAERLTDDEVDQLQASLTEIGPWLYVGQGTSGIHRAERAGTHRYEQASLTARGLIEAVRKREAELVSREPEVVPVATGVTTTVNMK